MAKKKNRAVLVVREDDMAQAQPLLEQYHEIASELHRSFSIDQAEPALTNINNLPEASQVAFLKALAKERHVDAADVLLALNELSPSKNMRKEARRALIHMEEAKIYPHWALPKEQTSRYRIVVPSFDADEELPSDNNVGDFIEEDESEDYDYDDVDIDELSPERVVETFVLLWVKSIFSTPYDLLTDDSPLRGGLAKDEWMERRKAWAEKAKLNRYELETGFIFEQTAQEKESRLADEASVEQATSDNGTNHKTIVLDWSMVFNDIAFNEPLPELPQATLVYNKTGRHWFWTNYELIEQENGSWRIYNMTDEGLKALQLPATVLRERIEGHKSFINELKQKYNPTNREEVAPLVDVSLWRIIQTIHYYDALVKQVPPELALYEEIAGRMFASLQYERSMVYTEMIAERFSEVRADTLRLLASIQKQYGDFCYEEENDERALRFIEMAEENLRESLVIENTFAAHMALAEILMEDSEVHLDEAVDHLREAKALSSGPADEANVEIQLGKIDIEREQDEDALHHYQRAIELEPGSAPAWFNLADAQYKLKNVEAAIESYRHAIQLQPDDENLYVRLSLLYKSERQDDLAIEVLKEGLDLNPNSFEISISLATFFMTIDDYEQGEKYLDKAAEIDADSLTVGVFRSMLDSLRTMATSKSTGRNVAAKPARQVVESLPVDSERTSKPFKPSHPKKKSRKKK